MSPEFDKKHNEALTAQQLRAVGNFALWADEVTDNLPFTVSTLSLMEEIQTDHPEVQIRLEQLECLDAIEDARSSGQERALVQMATGLGKTTVVAADVKRFLKEKPDARVLFLCHQNDILSQARERFENIIGPNHTYGNFTGEEQDYHEVTCLFASFQAMREWKAAFHEDEFDYVVVDESHHGKAPTYEPTLKYFKPEFMLGVTATPDRHDLKDIHEIFGDEIYRLSLEEAIARGLLAKVEYNVITDEIANTNVLRDLRGKRLNIRQLDRTIFIPKRDTEIIRIINEKASKFEIPKRIVFCKSIEQTEEYAQYFECAAPLHSKLPKWEQNKYIEQFRNGKIVTLLTVDMFNEGIDIPDANQLIFLRSTQSKTIFLQQLGRGLRKIPGKENVQILDFVANCDRLVMLDEVWRLIQTHADKNSGPSGPNPDIMRIDIGEIHFSDIAREVLEILAEIETQKTLFRNWTKQDSIDYYLGLCIKENKKISSTHLRHLPHINPGAPPGDLVLKPFGGNITNLHAEIQNQLEEIETARESALKERLLKYLIDYAHQHGRTPTWEKIKSIEDAPDASDYNRLFGSYAGYKKAANLRWLAEVRARNKEL